MPEHVDPSIRLAHRNRLFIGGEWREPIDGGLLAVISPHDGRTVCLVASAGAQDVRNAAQAARDAFDHGPWPGWPLERRLAALEGMLAALERRKDELARYWTMQIGAVAKIAPFIVDSGLAAMRSAIAVARAYPFEEAAPSRMANAAVVRHEPVGTVAAIVPWNSPFTLLLNKIAPALAVGCTVVIKPSPETPLEAHVVAECAQEAGLPAGVVNMIPCDRAESALLVADPDIDKVSFTGSTAAGRAIAAVCAERIARCTLELGGKSAAIVLDDYPIESAADMLASTIVMLSGQICSMLGRAIVPRARQDELAQAIARRLDAVKVGDPFAPDTAMGPVASSRQADRVIELIESARQEGARLVTGGSRLEEAGSDCFIRPTLFSHVSSKMRIAQEEVFGPVLCLIPHDGEEDAIRIANDTVYGLNGAVLTNDTAAAWRVGRSVRSGKFAQNGFRFDFSLPSGGMKQSGIGREGGVEGLEAYLETKVMLMDAPQEP